MISNSLRATPSTPGLYSSPDHALYPSSTISWSTPSSSIGIMTGSDNSSPVDFAFEPPAVPNDSNFNAPYKPAPIKTGSFSSPTSISPSTVPYTPGPGQLSAGNSYPFNNGSFSSSYGLSSASSFSSTSGSATGGSFSSVDALPAISREFVRPSPTETRRPATAGGALQSRSPFAGFMPGGADEGQKFRRTSQRPTSSDGVRIAETIDEGNEGMFNTTNPFASTDKEVEAEQIKQISPQAPETSTSVDPRFVTQSRRASEPQFNVPGWQPQPSPYGQTDQVPSAAAFGVPPHSVSQQGYLQQQQVHQGYPRPTTYSGRPQTSDGLPSYPHVGNGIALPSAQSIARQIPGMSNAIGYFQPISSESKAMQPSLMPFRDDRTNSLGNLPASTSFLGDRGYSLDSGIPRAAGGAMRASYVGKPGSSSEMSQYELTFVQLGGPAPKKRPRRRFDEIERLYDCGWNGCEKSYGTLNHLNAHVAMQKHGEKRLPQEFKDMRKAWRKKKRELAAISANSQFGGNAPGWSQRASIGSSSTDSDWDRRDSAASMMSATSGFSHRPSGSYPVGYPAPSWSNGAESRPSTSSSIASSADGRSYFHPVQPNYSMSIAQPPYLSNVGNMAASARRASAPQHLPMPSHNPMVDGFRQTESDHLTPTAQNPFPQQRHGYSFATLTSPMNGQAMTPVGPNGEAPYGGNNSGLFAFQR
ncbi:hypothetical protein IAR55_006801 [Kwoniella newhampshirensis]|uniref:C2H2-type domain-containing protein n=1 Tax=Kwoniella newhampshirensis TaxID=1651941 RepID=A0AAW0YI68_9TREE